MSRPGARPTPPRCLEADGIELAQIHLQGHPLALHRHHWNASAAVAEVDVPSARAEEIVAHEVAELAPWPQAAADDRLSRPGVGDVEQEGAVLFDTTTIL